MIMKSNIQYPISPPSERSLLPARTILETKLIPPTMPDEHVPVTSIPQNIPRAIHAIRRTRSPPRNENNQMFCDHVACQGKDQTFRRVCSAAAPTTLTSLTRQPSAKRRRLSVAGPSPSARQQEIKPRVATMVGVPLEDQDGNRDLPQAADVEGDLVQSLRAEIRQREDVIRQRDDFIHHQTNELQRLQALLRDLPTQRIYAVTSVLQPGMPPGGTRG
ncbi:hypothetical protein B0A52_04754 [Exophiala mesophila]|uniref:Uncharacterized protein n=1 Tax=Exophiala mesophila TaxID=212818 RepID=A0A438N8P7_EXOME|nr:hypothetical protein B0A52_04754 [Exophiala mesophila]